MYNQTVSSSVQMTLIPISFGVGYATVYDLSLNTFGLCKSYLSFIMDHLF